VSWRRFCKDAHATTKAGEAFAAILRPGDIVLLSGELGAGKTTFTQGVARGLGVSERVTSPTFTIVRQHEAHNELGITTLHHADVYRIQSLDEVLDLALGELVDGPGVAIVEWGDLAASVFGREVIDVAFSVGDDDGRTLVVSGASADDRSDALERWAEG
jgi:tRNA threonylcarbamoyladenosine biosynthesis protein TsaE